MPPRNLPFPPMEAELVDGLPDGEWQYEPKWDGFRGVLENLGGGLRLWSRNGRPLLRYFPELEEVGGLLPPDSALDGEIIISREGKLEFDQLQLRLHPAESRSAAPPPRTSARRGAGPGPPPPTTSPSTCSSGRARRCTSCRCRNGARSSSARRRSSVSRLRRATRSRRRSGLPGSSRPASTG